MTKCLNQDGIFLKVNPPETKEAHFLRACEKGDATVVRAILENNEMILKTLKIEENNSSLQSILDAKNHHGQNGFHLACSNDRLEIVEQLLEKSNRSIDMVNTSSDIGLTGLQVAKSKRYDRIVKCLKQFESNSVNLEDDTRFMLMNKKADPQFTPLKIKTADQKTMDESKRTPLHTASLNGHLEVAEHLIAKGATIDAKEIDGSTPLILAAQEGHLKVIDLLVSNNADINAATNDGVTALYMASEKSDMDICRYLISEGCDINAIDDRKSTPIHAASLNGHLEVAEYLIAKGAKINAKDIYGFTPLIVAAQEGHLKMVELLVCNKADINATTNYGYTPLHWASKEGHLDICRYLIAEGCDVTIESEYGTALDVAAIRGHQDIVNLLKPLM